ncbi:peptidase U32 [Chitinivibrio alkaliphilus ACht1]|uniref:Peptidase U32 n=2 Tax=Chitinivibrio TaxID=1505231 RepID=U7D6I9_9BACT|nr:peptidase U32 [Chitinivibrio alkaliphilus ACht1]
MKQPELLAPAGNFESLEAAFLSGADAVYLGMGVLNLRAYSDNFIVTDLPQIMELAHRFQGKIYVVLNILPNDTELESVREFLQEMVAQSHRPHAFIVSDPGVLVLCKEYCPDIELHLSTQTGTFNTESVRFWVKQGIRRVVLPREFDSSQIAQIVGASLCETEIFVHGALCMSLSGRCLMGAYYDGRHPNHGECSQPCRFPYDLIPHGTSSQDPSPSFALRLEQDERGTYIFNSKDLNTLPLLPSLLSLGADSLKIEGRNKSVNYITTVVRAYRIVIDTLMKDPSSGVDPALVEQLNELDHRPYTTGFLGGDNQLQSTGYAKEKSKIRVLGRVKDVLTGGRAVVDVKNPIVCGEALSLLPVNQKKGPCKVRVSGIYDLSGNLVERAVTNRLVVVVLEGGVKLRIGDMLRRTI